MRYLFIALLCLPFAAQAEWTDVETTDNLSAYYVSTDSERFTNSELIIMAYPNDECKLYLGNMFRADGTSTGERQSAVRFRVDTNPVIYETAKQTRSTYDETSVLVFYVVQLSERFTRQIVTGNRVLFDDNESDDSLKTDSFSLIGSSAAISKVVTACQNHDDWSSTPTDDEWSM